MSKYEICYSQCLSKSRVARVYVLDRFKMNSLLLILCFCTVNRKNID